MSSPSGFSSTWASPGGDAFKKMPKTNRNQAIVKSDINGQYIEVTCGDNVGNLYIAKFKKGSPSTKCILFSTKWYSLVEF